MSDYVPSLGNGLLMIVRGLLEVLAFILFGVVELVKVVWENREHVFEMVVYLFAFGILIGVITMLALLW